MRSRTIVRFGAVSRTLATPLLGGCHRLPRSGIRPRPAGRDRRAGRRTPLLGRLLVMRDEQPAPCPCHRDERNDLFDA